MACDNWDNRTAHRSFVSHRNVSRKGRLLQRSENTGLHILYWFGFDSVRNWNKVHKFLRTKKLEKDHGVEALSKKLMMSLANVIAN